MSLRSNGSYIGPRPAGPSTSTASGIWDLRTAERQNRNSQWPAFASDTYFANVSLLLHMDGSGSTFVDSSAYGRTVTANGDVTQSTSQSKFGGKSAYFDGSGDWLSTASGSLSLSGDWTIELWMRPTSLTGTLRTIFHAHADGARGVHFSHNGSSLLLDDGTAGDYSAGGIIDADAWQFLSVTKSGSSVYVHKNGTLLTTRTAGGSGKTYGTPTRIYIARYQDGVSTSGFLGWMDDIRITEGVARYSSASYTVPTAAFPDASLPSTGI